MRGGAFVLSILGVVYNGLVSDDAVTSPKRSELRLAGRDVFLGHDRAMRARLSATPSGLRPSVTRET